MVFIPPPHLAPHGRLSYGQAYTNILTAYRRAPLTSAVGVIILVAPDVDSLCAARMLADLLKQDDVLYRINPVSGHARLEEYRDELAQVPDLHTLILINMGAILDLPSDEWFGDFPEQLTVHVIDSTRPQNLSSLFGVSAASDRIVIWDDGGVEKLAEERRAFEVLTYEPEPESDEEADFEQDEPEDEEDEYEEGSSTGKRRSLGTGDRSPKRRRKMNPERASREERDRLAMKLHKYYTSGTSHGQSACGTIYLLATVLERADLDLLWLAILGLTYQYNTSRISRLEYERYHSVYFDEVARLNPPPPASANKDYEHKAQGPDDRSVFATDELRFTLFRHWNMYDAMYHSSYVASKLGIWKEKGRRRLTGLLAKMGFSVQETQQPYTHMAKDLKLILRDKLNQIAPEYGLLELTYPSFARCCGYIANPVSAGDAVEALSALLDIANGTRIEVEVEGNRNGGEWFGAGKIWDAGGQGGVQRREDEGLDNIIARGVGGQGDKMAAAEHGDDEQDEEGPGANVWLWNFWIAFDALNDISILLRSLPLAKALQCAVIRQGTSIIDKHDIKTFRGHRVVILSQGPDLHLFIHPGVLSRLALWLVDALREKTGNVMASSAKARKKGLPLLVACLNEKLGTYMVVGVTAAMDFGEVQKNEFGLAFLDAKERCNARTRHGSFDTSCIEIAKDDLKMFLETMCDGGAD